MDDDEDYVNVEDLTQLVDLSQPIVMKALEERYKSKKIYTDIGTILVSINPYQFLPAPALELKLPHVNKISQSAHEQLLDTQNDQSILVSGESGAGKTEAMKIVLQYLAEKTSADGDMQKQILASNPILEAFGNAKTVRNDNSSRFGKYIQVFFDSQFQIHSAMIQNYLLEKVRVVSQNKGERNFHIFYQMCRGATQDELNSWGLQRHPGMYNYCTDEDLGDEEEFKIVLESFKRLGIDPAPFFKVAAIVLHLGNIAFHDNDSSDEGSSMEKSQHTRKAAELLGVTEEKLQSAFTFRLFTAGGRRGSGAKLYPRKKVEADDARDALAKFIFDQAFQLLNEAINASISLKRPTHMPFIGVLDIFGFEIFDHNTFEQLCINYANEKLQQDFNANIFRIEQQIYKDEGIDFANITYADNQPILSLIEDKPKGILPTIDEVQRFPRASDETLMETLDKHHFKKSAPYAKNPLSQNCFTLHHYAGDVEYSITGFLEKNRDTLAGDLQTLLQGSSDPMFKKFMESKSNKDMKQTVSGVFRSQLKDLMQTIQSTNVHYIRCIKPNENKSSREFNSKMILSQLANSGVFEAIRIRKCGYPYRYTHEFFCKRYKALMPSLEFSNPKRGAKKLVAHIAIDNVHVGKTKVLCKSVEHAELEKRRKKALAVQAIMIQRHYRAYCVRSKWIELVAQRAQVRDAIAKRELETVKEALDVCADVWLPFPELETAKKLLARLEVEKKVVDMLEKCAAGDPQSDLALYEKALKAAADIELESTLRDDVQARYNRYLQHKQFLERVELALRPTPQEDKLRQILIEAVEIEAQEYAVVGEAEEWINAVDEQEGIARDLAAVIQKLQLDDSKTLEELGSLVERGQDMKWIKPGPKKQFEESIMYDEIYGRTYRAQKEQTREAWELCKTSLNEHKSAYSSMPAWKQCNALMETQFGKFAVLDKAAQLASQDLGDDAIESINAVIVDAQKKDVEGESITRLHAILHDVKECNAMLEKGMQEESLSVLHDGLQMAKKIRYERSRIVQNAQAMHSKVKAKLQELIDTAKKLCHVRVTEKTEHDIAETLKKAAEVDLKDEILDALQARSDALKNAATQLEDALRAESITLLDNALKYAAELQYETSPLGKQAKNTLEKMEQHQRMIVEGGNRLLTEPIMDSRFAEFKNFLRDAAEIDEPVVTDVKERYEKLNACLAMLRQGKLENSITILEDALKMAKALNFDQCDVSLAARSQCDRLTKERGTILTDAQHFSTEPLRESSLADMERLLENASRAEIHDPIFEEVSRLLRGCKGAVQDLEIAVQEMNPDLLKQAIECATEFHFTESDVAKKAISINNVLSQQVDALARIDNFLCSTTYTQAKQLDEMIREHEGTEWMRPSEADAFAEVKQESGNRLRTLRAHELTTLGASEQTKQEMEAVLESAKKNGQDDAVFDELRTRHKAIAECEAQLQAAITEGRIEEVEKLMDRVQDIGMDESEVVAEAHEAVQNAAEQQNMAQDLQRVLDSTESDPEHLQEIISSFADVKWARKEDRNLFETSSSIAHLRSLMKQAETTENNDGVWQDVMEHLMTDESKLKDHADFAIAKEKFDAASEALFSKNESAIAGLMERIGKNSHSAANALIDLPKPVLYQSVSNILDALGTALHTVDGHTSYQYLVFDVCTELGRHISPRTLAAHYEGMLRLCKKMMKPTLYLTVTTPNFHRHDLTASNAEALIVMAAKAYPELSEDKQERLLEAILDVCTACSSSRYFDPLIDSLCQLIDCNPLALNSDLMVALLKMMPEFKRPERVFESLSNAAIAEQDVSPFASHVQSLARILRTHLPCFITAEPILMKLAQEYPESIGELGRSLEAAITDPQTQELAFEVLIVAVKSGDKKVQRATESVLSSIKRSTGQFESKAAGACIQRLLVQYIESYEPDDILRSCVRAQYAMAKTIVGDELVPLSETLLLVMQKAKPGTTADLLRSFKGMLRTWAKDESKQRLQQNAQQLLLYANNETPDKSQFQPLDTEANSKKRRVEGQ